MMRRRLGLSVWISEKTFFLKEGKKINQSFDFFVINNFFFYCKKLKIASFKNLKKKNEKYIKINGNIFNFKLKSNFNEKIR